MRKLLTLALFAATLGTSAQTTSGGITPQMLEKISHAYPANPALRNALAGTSINQLATRADNPDQYDTHFSNEVPSRGITDQKSSGRCWLFTGLNVMRAKNLKDGE